MSCNLLSLHCHNSPKSQTAERLCDNLAFAKNRNMHYALILFRPSDSGHSLATCQNLRFSVLNLPCVDVRYKLDQINESLLKYKNLEALFSSLGSGYYQAGTLQLQYARLK